jgi:hypothetical protein
MTTEIISSKKRYNKELLDIYIKRDSATLIENYSDIGNYGGGGKRADIRYRCNCGIEHTKSFSLIESAGAICKECVKKNQCIILASGRIQENINRGMITRGNPENTNKIYNKKNLEECIIRDGARLIGEYISLFGHTDIDFTCKCGSKDRLPFNLILGKTNKIREKGNCGAFCNSCSKLRSIQIRNNTNMDRHGRIGGINQNQASKERGIETSMQTYGVPSPNMAEEVKEKKKQTCIQRYNVENPMQDPEIFERCMKAAKNKKIYVMPSGDNRIVQGYEPHALDILLNDEGLNEQQIKTNHSDKPIITYLDYNGESHKHYIDIYIPHQNRIIEVKSTWTYTIKEDCIKLKMAQAIKDGYNYEIWIIDKDGNRISEE